MTPLPFRVQSLLATVVALASAPVGFEVSDYAVELEIDREGRRLSGHERVRLRSTQDGLEVVRFPRNGIEIRSVTSERGAPLSFTVEPDALAIRPPRPLSRGQRFSFVVAYSAMEPKGIVFGADVIYTLFFTCHWMICRDGPEDKATFTLSLAVPEGQTLIASGEPTTFPTGGPPVRGASGHPSRRDPERPPARQTWKEDRPSSPYLFGFALGPFARSSRRHRGVTLEYFTLGKDEAWRNRAFADDGQMLDFFVEKAGRRFPQRTYRQVVVNGSAAQELSSFSILGSKQLDARMDDPTEDWLVAHEMAHQFWGNLVTCADWSHFWLNEGLTTFLVAAYKERRWGRQAYERELELLRARHQFAVDASFDVPLTFGGDYPSLRIKRAITYSKGALFLALLRQTVGERAFWRALRRYTRRFAGKTATTRDFERILADSSGRDLSALFRTWAYEPPAPEEAAPVGPSDRGEAPEKTHREQQGH